MLPEISAGSPGSFRQIPPDPIAPARAARIPYKARRLRSLPSQTPRPKCIALNAALFAEMPPVLPVALRPLPASPASAVATPAPALAAASGNCRNPACAPTLPAPASCPVAARYTAAGSSRPDAASLVRLFRSRGPSRCQRGVSFERLPQFMPGAQQHDANKRASYPELVRNLVVTHV